MRKKRGLSLVEILVATVIFSLIMLGMIGVFVAAKRQILHARERMVSAEISKFFIDPFQMDVRQDTWNSNDLNLSEAPRALPTQRINSLDFVGTYTVADGTSDSALTGTDLRRVTTTITWTEMTP